MDAKNSANMFKHLEKQSEVLMESYRAMSHELHRLQVEEEMLMQKLYEVMSAEGLLKKLCESRSSGYCHVKLFLANGIGYGALLFNMKHVYLRMQANMYLLSTLIIDHIFVRDNNIGLGSISVVSRKPLLNYLKKDKQKDSRHVDMKEKDKDSDDEENLSSED